jgi:riboflavin synthase
MFTGIVEEIGHVKSLWHRGSVLQLLISAKAVLEGLKAGDSVAVNGVCLTATNAGRSDFMVDIVEETLLISTLDSLKVQDEVNLERALKVSDRLSGHIVGGHIDGVGIIKNIIKNSASTKITFWVPENLRKYFVHKGSISVDGVSLTVAEVGRETFSVAVIPHTIKTTNLGKRKIGDKVNLETDMLAKYIEGYFRHRNADGPFESPTLRDVLAEFIEWSGGASACN